MSDHPVTTCQSQVARRHPRYRAVAAAHSHIGTRIIQLAFSFVLIGDAAGLVDPITREGIFFALRSAEIAAAALTNESTTRLRYVEQLEAEIYSELLVAARLKMRFYRPAFLALLTRALQRSAGVRAVMADLVAGEQPYRTLRRRLLATMEWRLMLELIGIGNVTSRSTRLGRER